MVAAKAIRDGGSAALGCAPYAHRFFIQQRGNQHDVSIGILARCNGRMGCLRVLHNQQAQFRVFGEPGSQPSSLIPSWTIFFNSSSDLLSKSPGPPISLRSVNILWSSRPSNSPAFNALDI